MRTRDFGRLGAVSALTLGGGGIGGVWGATDRAEAVATVHGALEAGVTMLDLAPSYGPDHEAERVAGEALAGLSSAEHPLITTKVEAPDDEIAPHDVPARIRESLAGSLQRLGREQVDLLLLHSQLRPPGDAARAPRTAGWSVFQEQVLPTFLALREEGLIRDWGLTGVGHPAAVLEALAGEETPGAVQVVVNALDLSGDMWIFGEQATPRNGEILASARRAGVPVIGIRAVAAGALTGGIDRAVDPGHPVVAEYERAAGFRELAAELGESPAALAHRCALDVDGVATVVLGVKNREELEECLDAERRGPLSGEERRAVAALRAGR
ncbi:aldo/keto reductase [Brachybacterium sp. YJGR34]|uniref:aldo/keto reductase n=1 Tax=Brachybacterium sp. YJGR34 TaxID=2059911 RepID=UPI000E0AA88E|nr:aldo/keto reductase [Brachybacterium sp. YJGR34]